MAQADLAPIPIRPAQTTPDVIYIPIIRLDHGPYVPEMRVGKDTTKDTIIADIASSQHDEVLRVLAIDTENGKSWDASIEIAGLVLDAVLKDHDRVPGWCIDFLEAHLGCGYVAQAEREAA